MDSNKKTKLYFLLGICLMAILGLWFYSFKLNLNYSLNKGNQGEKNGLDLNSFKNELMDIFKKSPLTNGKSDLPSLPKAEATASNEDWQKLADEMAKNIKGLNKVNGTSTPTTTNNVLK